AGDALAQRPARARRRLSRAADPVPQSPFLARDARAARDRRRSGRLRDSPPAALLPHGHHLTPPTRRPLDADPFPDLRLHPPGAPPAPALRSRLQQLLGTTNSSPARRTGGRTRFTSR